MSVGIIGHTGWDVVSTPTEATQRRLGGTPLYAARALRALGVEPVVITKGADLPDAIVLPSRYTFESVLVHSAEATDQQLASVGEPFTAAEARAMLPLLDGCEWVILGGQASTDFPTDMIAVLAAAGLRVCIDAQGLARGPDPGPLRLRPFPARAVAGASMLKLSQAEAMAVCGTWSPRRWRRWASPKWRSREAETGRWWSPPRVSSTAPRTARTSTIPPARATRGWPCTCWNGLAEPRRAPPRAPPLQPWIDLYAPAA